MALRSHPRRRRGSVLVIVLVMLLITAAMLVAFIDKASTDLIVEARQTRAQNLRAEAYSALEVTLAVLNLFVQADGNALRNPHEGWADPLEFAEWEPSEGRTIEVTFEDESGKISLPTVTNTTLNTLFESWEMTPTEAADLTDCILSWINANYTPSSDFLRDYSDREVPYAVPGRSLLSFDELAAINDAEVFFYDEEGRPNDYWYRFVDTFSLFSFDKPNLNAYPTHPDVLTAVGQFQPDVQQRLSDYLGATGEYLNVAAPYFRLTSDAIPVLGAGGVDNFGTLIRALRVHITVREGANAFRLSAVIAPPNGATIVQSDATNDPTATSSSGTNATNANPTPTGGRGGNANAANGAAAANDTNTLQYPFTVLQILEDSDPPPPVSDESEDPLAL